MRDLLTLGDSINGAPEAWPNRYPGDVLNLAVVGARISALPEQVAVAEPAHLTVVSIGVNDVLADDELDTDGLDCLRGMERVLLLVPHQTFDLSNPHAARMAPRLRAVHEALADTGHDLLDPRLRRWEWQRDGIHPNRLGHRRIAQAVRQSDRTWFQRKSA